MWASCLFLYGVDYFFVIFLYISFFFYIFSSSWKKLSILFFVHFWLNVKKYMKHYMKSEEMTVLCFYYDQKVYSVWPVILTVITQDALRLETSEVKETVHPFSMRLCKRFHSCSFRIYSIFTVDAPWLLMFFAYGALVLCLDEWMIVAQVVRLKYVLNHFKEF